MDFSEAQKRSKAVNRKFILARKLEWKPEVMLADMAEEVGELANAILVDRGFKSRNRKRAEIADSLCDILFDIFMVAEYYGLEMGTEYEKVLKKITERIESGEFSDR
jgi:NTP pyrophosphatase (non-canonical NTP hydrolase)